MYRFYGRRTKAGLRPGRQFLINDVLPRYAVPTVGVEDTLDPSSLFDSSCREYWLEIGFGSGEHLVHQAQDHPHVGLIGSEVYRPGVSMAVRQLAALEVHNVRVYADDARPLLHALPPDCLDRVFLLFPDPWPKARHFKRRFFQPHQLQLLARVMKKDALFQVATDHLSYADWIVDHIAAQADFRLLHENRPDHPPTRYEEKAAAQGRKGRFFLLQRV